MRPSFRHLLPSAVCVVALPPYEPDYGYDPHSLPGTTDGYIPGVSF